jgi:SAM-dependent methyltransferase
MDRELLERFIGDYPFQPATAVWRAVEIAHVLASPLPSGRGLDLGCGDGLLTRIVAERAGWDDIVGIDPDAEEAELARRIGIYRTVHVASAVAIPQPDSSFDWVFSNSVLEHIDAIHDVLREVARVLAPGGSFVFTVPGEHFHDCLRGPFLPWRPRAGYLDLVDRRTFHLRYWTAREWAAHLDTHGMDIVASAEYMTVAEVQRWENVARFTSGVLFVAAGGRSQPITIQRRLHLRRGKRAPAPLARVLAAGLGAGLGNSVRESRPSPLRACLMVRAARRR